MLSYNKNFMVKDVQMFIVMFFVFVNMIALSIMLWDKISATHGKQERISEGMLFFLAVLFGSVGVLAGMLLCRHKIRKWYFRVGIPMLIVQNCATLYVIYLFFM